MIFTDSDRRWYRYLSEYSVSHLGQLPKMRLVVIDGKRYAPSVAAAHFKRLEHFGLLKKIGTNYAIANAVVILPENDIDEMLGNNF